ncbi:MAG: phosphoribosyltransferase family protein [Candidatus Sericytochromatia bacterium]|nr:phosphoribosyltransferase family protein [Candidatus Sericytochromatia bacterium]
MAWADRKSAGEALSSALMNERDGRCVVIGLPRGGVAVAAPVARALAAPLDIRIVKKIETPGAPELALGAVTDAGITVWNEPLVQHFGLTPSQLATAREDALAAAKRRAAKLRGACPSLPLQGRHVLLVDDGMATGMTVAAAVAAIRQEQPARLVVACPVASATASKALARRVDRLVTLAIPADFSAVGLHYADFTPVEEAEVSQLLREAHASVVRQSS